MDLETLATLVTMLAAMAGLAAYLRNDNDRTRRELRAEIRSEIASLRTELKADINRVDDRVAKLDDRVYALAVGIRPLIEQAEHQA